MADTFYRSFRERRPTAFGASRRRRVEQSRLALLHRFAGPPGDLVEIGPGDGSLATWAVEAGWRYRAVEASPALAADLRAHGFAVRRWCAAAGRPTRFKPSRPSPPDAVRDGSAKLGHPVQNVTREHGLTPLPR